MLVAWMLVWHCKVCMCLLSIVLCAGGQAHRAKELLSHVESPSEGTLVWLRIKLR